MGDCLDEKNYEIGKKLIETAVNLDAALIEILKVEIKLIKKLLNQGTPTEDLQRANNLMKNVIMVLMLADDQIKTGMELCRERTQPE